jgi:TonB family protein
MTQLGSRPVQQQLTEARKSVEPVRAPAARAPEMIEPKKAAPKKSETKAAEAKDPRSKTPTKGEEVRPGEAVAETKNRGQGFGLSSSGTDSSGGYLDVANFCCPEYLTTMRSMINQRWDGQQQAAAETTMKFVIQRDGRLTNIAIEKSSGYAALDLLAQRALVLTKQLPPLPAQFDQPSLTVYFIFRYQR